jgi:UDP-N-acetyl-D-mannosaminuronic acid dehydrogenase
MLDGINKAESFARVSVVGLGYIGLPTAAVLASRKIEVIGVDVNQQVVDTIDRGEIYLVEPDLDMLVHAVVSEGYLRATLKPEPSDAFLIAVPTPFKAEHQPDLSYIQAAVHTVAPVLKRGDLVLLESTSPVGTTEQLVEWLADVRPDLTFPLQHGEQSDIRIAYCPERVLPGYVLRELVQNDRVIGGLTKACSARAIELYQLFVEGECITTDARTAEMCKLAENSFRDVNISFANELSMICDKLNINVSELIHLASRHPRVNILRLGAGVGGHCIAVDPWFIVSSVHEEAQLIKMARQVNEEKPIWVVQKAMSAIALLLQKKPEKTARDVSIACFGLTFKPDIDDLRESPALQIATQIRQMQAGLLFVVEPNIKTLPKVLSESARLVESDIAVAEADIVLILVNHKSFEPVFERMLEEKNRIIDTRGL